MVCDNGIPLNGEDQHRKVTKVFRMWNKRLLRSAAAHYMAAELYEARETFLSVTNIIFAITVLFLSASQHLLGMDFTTVVPVFSLIVVLLSAYQYIQQYASKASIHKQAGNEFSNLRRKMERYWTKDKLHPEAIHSLNRSYNFIAKSPPLVPKKIWEKSLQYKLNEIEGINRFLFLLDDEDENEESCP